MNRKTASSPTPRSDDRRVEKAGRDPAELYEPGPGYRQNDGFSHVRDIQPTSIATVCRATTGSESAPAPNLTADYASLDDEMKENVISASPTFNWLMPGIRRKIYDWPDIHSPHLMKAPVAGAANSPMMKLLREHTVAQRVILPKPTA